MTKFLVIYTSPMSLVDQIGTMTEEEMGKTMQEWQAWGAKMGANLLDFGAPLGAADSVGGEPATGVMNVGYSFIEADDIAAAKTLLDGHPHLGWDPAVSIAIHEVKPVPGGK